jgi:hypothetical protein
MSTGAECNQILRHIAANLAPRPHVMNLQGLHGDAVLAAPTISLQHLVSNQGVFFRVQFEDQSRLDPAAMLTLGNSEQARVRYVPTERIPRTAIGICPVGLQRESRYSVVPCETELAQGGR